MTGVVAKAKGGSEVKVRIYRAAKSRWFTPSELWWEEQFFDKLRRTMPWLPFIPRLGKSK